MLLRLWFVCDVLICYFDARFHRHIVLSSWSLLCAVCSSQGGVDHWGVGWVRNEVVMHLLMIALLSTKLLRGHGARAISLARFPVGYKRAGLGIFLSIVVCILVNTPLGL